jgi:hypothetical protein
MKFYDEFKDRRKDFEILAFHDAKASDLQDLDAKLNEEGVKERHWGGRDLPFPILMDATGATIRAYGVSSFPTIIVIDPKGKLVRHGGEHTIREHLFKTDPAVKRILGQLKAARKPEQFEAAVTEIEKTVGDKAGFALNSFAEKATPAQVKTIADAFERMGGAYALGFFWGDHGLGAKDKAARIRAAEVIGKHGDKNYLFSLSKLHNEEEDPDVKKALSDALTEINNR